MRTIIKLGALLLLFSCNNQEIPSEVKPQSNQPYFAPQEVITGLMALTAIIDWPSETVSHQKNMEVSVAMAQKLILPLHPLYDEKIDEVAASIASWDKAKVNSMISDCAIKCECEFYQEVLDRHPEVLTESTPELKSFAGTKILRTKEITLNCLQHMSSIQNLLKYLHSEVKNYEASSNL